MYATEAEFNMNDVIFEQGWQSDAVYLLQKGDVELYAGGVNELQTGPCIIGEYSTLHDTNRKVSVKAKSSKAIVYLISKQDLFSVLTAFRDIERTLKDDALKILTDLQYRLGDLLSIRNEARVRE